jgi:hypothetical protein
MDCLPHIHVAAVHAESGYRSFTPGIGVLCGSRILAGAGVYSNSYGDASAYGAVGMQPWTVGGWKFGAVTGVVTGYAKSPAPLGALLVSYGVLHLSILPPVKGKTPAVVAFSFTWR